MRQLRRVGVRQRPRARFRRAALASAAVGPHGQGVSDPGLACNATRHGSASRIPGEVLAASVPSLRRVYSRWRRICSRHRSHVTASVVGILRAKVAAATEPASSRAMRAQGQRRRPLRAAVQRVNLIPGRLMCDTATRIASPDAARVWPPEGVRLPSGSVAGHPPHRTPPRFNGAPRASLHASTHPKSLRRSTRLAIENMSARSARPAAVSLASGSEAVTRPHFTVPASTPGSVWAADFQLVRYSSPTMNPASTAGRSKPFTLGTRGSISTSWRGMAK